MTLSSHHYFSSFYFYTVYRPDEDDFDDCDVEVVTSGRLGRTVPKGATNINRPFSLDSDRDRDRERERDDVEDNNTIIAGMYWYCLSSFFFDVHNIF